MSSTYEWEAWNELSDRLQKVGGFSIQEGMSWNGFPVVNNGQSYYEGSAAREIHPTDEGLDLSHAPTMGSLIAQLGDRSLPVLQVAASAGLVSFATAEALIAAFDKMRKDENAT